MIGLLIGVVIGLLVSRTSVGTSAYTYAANLLGFLPRP